MFFFLRSEEEGKRVSMKENRPISEKTEISEKRWNPCIDLSLSKQPFIAFGTVF